MATAKRARQVVDGDDPLTNSLSRKPLSIAVDEIYEGAVHILPDEGPVEN